MPQELRQMHTTTEARPANDVGSSVHLDKFFVFHWLSERDSHRMSENRLREDLKAIDIFLKKCTDLDERSIYTTCSSLEWEDVVRPLRSQADLLRKSSASTESEDEKERRRIHSIKVDVYNAAESLFEFFLPLLTRGARIDRFWGALGSLLESMGNGENGNARSPRHKQRQIASYSERDLYAICDGLNSLLYIAKPFQNLFSHATREDRAGLQRPNELAKAWLHIVMALAYASEYSELWADHLRSAEKLLRTGTKMVVQSINKRSILHNSVVMPHEIANLVNFGLLHDICSIEKNESGNITQTYRTYLEKLRSEMLRSPLFRGHQDNILLLKQEIAVILETLAAQRQVFLNRDSYNDQNRSRPRTYSRIREEDDDDYGHRSRSHRVPERTTSKRYDQSYHHQYSMGPSPPDTNIAMAGGVINIDLSPTDPGGYRDLLMQECLRLVNKKITDFEKMDEEAKDLEAWNILRIETNKDRQDVAIYTFTVVTIIFLPLSTVASILGMNTYDVRNMEQRQWVFWTVAIPLLVLVIFLCLVWTGELSNFWTGFKNLFRKDNRQITRRSERLGYDRIGDELAALSLEVPPEQFQRERSRYQYVDSDQYSTDPVNRIVLAPGDLYSQRSRVRSHAHHHRRSSYARQRSR